MPNRINDKARQVVIMGTEVKGLLQKINFIEADMDLHRQILVSIPPENKEEIKETIKKIAELKNQIAKLRQQIKEVDEGEYNKIIAIEKAVETFRKISIDKKFVVVNTLNETGECYVTLNDGTRIDSLVAAKEENGNWTVLTLDGEVKEYPVGIIAV
jgi:uncharacterized protein YlxW (UPF0749 family)